MGGLRIEADASGFSPGRPTADRRLYLTADKSRVVEDGDPEAAYLFAAEGGELDPADVERYGIIARPPASTDEDEEKDADAPSAAKAGASPRRRGAS